MRVLYLHQYYCPEGGWGNDRSRAFAAAWAAEGCAVDLITTTAYFPAGRPAQNGGRFVFEENGVRVVSFDVPYRQDFSYAQKTRAFIAFYRKLLQESRRLPKPDVVWASSTPPSVGEAGRRLARRFGVPFVFETVDVWPDVPQDMGALRNPLLLGALHFAVNRIYREAAAIVALSEGMKAQICRHGVPADKVTVLHNGTDPQLFRPEETPSEGPPTVLYAGALGRANNAGVLLVAAEALKDEFPEARFAFYGWGAEREILETRARNLPNAEFHAPLPKPELAAVMRKAAVGAATFAPFPSLEANSANKFYDYLACGLPVVTNYAGWQAEYLRKYACGLSAPQSDPGALIENLRRLLENPALRRQMGANARRLAVEKFDRQLLAGKALALLKRISQS